MATLPKTLPKLTPHNIPDAQLRIPSVRGTPDNKTVLENLGLLANLAGTWKGTGFNLVARPDKELNANLYLELNQTKETLQFTPISSSIPNRGFAMDDIEMFGLTYLQQITDSVTGGALHIEPGIWVRQPATTAPAETPPKGDDIVFRMGSIPHGNAHTGEGDCPEIHWPTHTADVDRGLQRVGVSVLQQHAIRRWRADLRARNLRVQSARPPAAGARAWVHAVHDHQPCLVNQSADPVRQRSRDPTSGGHQRRADPGFGERSDHSAAGSRRAAGG